MGASVFARTAHILTITSSDWQAICLRRGVRSAIAAFAGLVLFVTGCTSASTSTTAPSATKCGVSATPSLRSFPHTGGAGSIAVTSARDCTWTMSSDASWLVLERSSGQGETSLPFRVTPNDTPKARRGTVAIESTRLELAQEGAPCTFHLDNTHADIDAGGAVVRIEVTAMSDCAWSARALESWISVTSGASASGTGVVGLSIAANSGPARQGSVMIADQTISVTQQAFGSPAPSPVPSPPPSPAPPAPAPPSPAPPAPAPPSPAPPAPAPPAPHHRPRHHRAPHRRPRHHRVPHHRPPHHRSRHHRARPRRARPRRARPRRARPRRARPRRAPLLRNLLKWTARFRRCADRVRALPFQ